MTPWLVAAAVALGVGAGGRALVPPRTRAERVPRRHPVGVPARRLGPHSERPRKRGSRPPPTMSDTIDLLVLGLRSGLVPLTALALAAEHAAPDVRVALERVLLAVDEGTRLGDALTRLPSLVSTEHRTAATLLTDQLVAAELHGLPLAPMLERLAAETRERRRRSLDAALRRLPVRLSLPLVVCTLPSFVLVAVAPMLIAAIDALRR